MKKISVFEYAKYIKAAESASGFSLYDPAPIFRKEFTVRRYENAKIFVQSPGFACSFHISSASLKRRKASSIFS